MPPTMFLKEEDLRRRNWNKIEMVYTNACKDALHMHGNTKQEFFTQKSNFKDPAAVNHFFLQIFSPQSRRFCGLV